MPKIQPVWAIDIGQAALKALKLTPEGEEPDKLHAEAFDFIEYPKILSQPDADPEELVREALATFLGRNEVTNCRVALGVSGQAGLVKFIKLPPVEKKRIPDIVKFEARQQIPFALEEVVWDYQQIGGDEEPGEDEGFTLAEVGLFAMKRDQINRAIAPLKNAGIEVDIVQMGPIALYNFASVDRKVEKGQDQGSVVYCDIGADNTDLIITDGVRIWQRNVPIGGNHFTRALTKELKLTFAKAEHLKRNATKAPDPRAVFTAMRGIFNDFSSEINRSIGFYSSVNRTAKISKVVGLGNGFKLPGLQKFLQQNLSYDVEKLEAFEKLTGDEVLQAPQFIENLPSFAVAYGLAAQGLGRAGMKTNLLPPEIEQVRLVRRKKPWALAASTLMMLAFTVLFLADWSAWAKVTSEPFKAAVKTAKQASDQGASLKKAYDDAKAKFDAEAGRGKALVDVSGEAIDWPQLMVLINQTLPDPARELEINPDDPKNYDLLAKLNVYIDGIIPRYRTDLDAGWFSNPDAVNQLAKDSMHPYDRTNPPKGSGWVIQICAHHFNPYSLTKGLTEKEKGFALGSLPYIQRKILPRFWRPELRAAGITHAALTWKPEADNEWTTAKTASRGILAPILDYDSPKAAGSTASTGSSGSAGAGTGGSSGFAGGGAGRSMGAGMGMSLDGMMGMYGAGKAGAKDAKSDLKTLSRTDFKIDFVWQPKAPGEKPPELAEIKKMLEEAQAKSKGAVTLDEAALNKASVERSAKEVEKKAAAASTAGSNPLGGAGAGAGVAAPPTGAPASK